MRTLDQIYWDVECDDNCGCKDLAEALERHPRLHEIRDGKPGDAQTQEKAETRAKR